MAKNPLDDVAQRAAERMSMMVDKLPEDIEPFAAQKLSRQEQLERYAEMRDNPQAWMQIIQENGLDSAIEYWKTMEVRYADSPKPVGKQHFNPASAGSGTPGSPD